MKSNLSCPEVKDLLVLYAYGELSFDEEEAVDAHVAACPACTAERTALTALHAAADDVAAGPSLELLSACRQELRQQVAAIAASEAKLPFWRKWIPGAARPASMWNMLAKPALGAALFAAGFAGANLAPYLRSQVSPAAVAPAVTRNVRFIEPSGDGNVRIVYDEVSRRELAGRVDDRRVREMLLAATHDPDDPALRVDSVEFLKNRCEREEVRHALVRALTSDPNEGVRLKALDALKPYAAEPDVRSALTKVLLADQSALVRTQTIDFLVSARHDESQLAGVLQDLLRREQNTYIRQRGQSALRAMNASLETF